MEGFWAALSNLLETTEEDVPTDIACKSIK